MTPLHLAVWNSLLGEDHSTGKTLLEHNAYCSSKDDVSSLVHYNTSSIITHISFWLILSSVLQEGLTPLNHLSEGPGSEKLRKRLQQCLEEQRRQKALEACSQAKSKMDLLESELSNMAGLHELKLQLRKWAKGMLLDERRRSLGLKVAPRRPPHMAFLGNPGTGLLFKL